MDLTKYAGREITPELVREIGNEVAAALRSAGVVAKPVLVLEIGSKLRLHLPWAFSIVGLPRHGRAA